MLLYSQFISDEIHRSDDTCGFLSLLFFVPGNNLSEELKFIPANVHSNRPGNLALQSSFQSNGQLNFEE